MVEPQTAGDPPGLRGHPGECQWEDSLGGGGHPVRHEVAAWWSEDVCHNAGASGHVGRSNVAPPADRLPRGRRGHVAATPGGECGTRRPGCGSMDPTTRNGRPPRGHAGHLPGRIDQWNSLSRSPAEVGTRRSQSDAVWRTRTHGGCLDPWAPQRHRSRASGSIRTVRPGAPALDLGLPRRNHHCLDLSDLSFAATGARHGTIGWGRHQPGLRRLSGVARTGHPRRLSRRAPGFEPNPAAARRA
jgi:hypothetical protein